MSELKFRNLTVTPGDPVDMWGVEGVLTAIERGDLSHWHRIVAAVRRDPHGAVAANLEQALTLTEPYGIAVVLAQLLDEARLGEAGVVARRVRAAVLRSGLSARKFAAQVGTSPSRLSTYMKGIVVPSAALFLRIEAAGERLANGGLPHGSAAVEAQPSTA